MYKNKCTVSQATSSQTHVRLYTSAETIHEQERLSDLRGLTNPRRSASGAQTERRVGGPEDRREGRPAEGRRGQEVEGRMRREALDRAGSEVARSAAAGSSCREDAEVLDLGEVVAGHDLPCDEPDDADHGQAA
eukprot:CAMPEP_0183542802 /NCGR_PEP_ID=MMETSP0371-20130417/42615_1 /TAXON_ID=268820 /ORGANISM="Peridinium aciculiferum, Strain PAER-2" /LENGTH=133 /DNA_ID=CAMNT_0025744133 /DNA_START=81 /DNA_END=479 /DNA_ORIENTATION=-